jgi:hypothetical protein
MSQIAEIVEGVNDLVQEDRQITHWYNRQVGYQLCICIFCHPWRSWVSQNLCKLGAKAVYGWAQTHAWKCACNFCSEEGWASLKQIVTGNETWVHHFESASKYQSIEWKCMLLPRTKKFRNIHSASKVMLTLFWDFNGPILERYTDCGQSVNSTQYCAMLEE